MHSYARETSLLETRDITPMLQFSIVVCCVFVFSLLYHGLHHYVVCYVVTVHKEVVFKFFSEGEEADVVNSFVGDLRRLHILLLHILN